MRLLSGANRRHVTHPNNNALIQPQASRVQILSQHGDGWSATEGEKKNTKTANICFFSLVAPLNQKKTKKKTNLLNIRKEKKKLGPVHCERISVCMSSGDLADKINFKRSWGTFQWNHLLENLRGMTTHRLSSLDNTWSPITDSVLAHLQHTLPAVALGCGFLSTFHCLPFPQL